MHRIVLTALVAATPLCSAPISSTATDRNALQRSVTWAQRLFEENSLSASLLFWPNFFLGGLVRAGLELGQGREHPYVTIPPPAHRGSRGPCH
ncbi:MAG: hypothetical protein LDL33_07865 [Desulfomonile sp.]|nr:hypothetical protein [Desulfomonile sp.]